MSLIDEQQKYLATLGLSESEILQMVLQESGEKDQQLPQQTGEDIEFTRALRLQQDQEYEDSLIKDAQQIKRQKYMCGDMSPQTENNKDDDNDDPGIDNIFIKEGDIHALREARCNFFAKK